MATLKYKTSDGWKTLYGSVFNQVLLKSNNLSDVDNKQTARENLELTGNNNVTHFHDTRYMQRAEVQENLDTLNNTTTQRLNQIAADTEAQISAANTENTNRINALSNSVNGQLDEIRSDIEGSYAKKDASNALVNNWASKLGIGAVASDDNNLVTGQTVKNAIDTAIIEAFLEHATVSRQNLNTNGYIEFNNGLMLQWGKAYVTNNSNDNVKIINFNQPFVTEPYAIIANMQRDTGSNSVGGSYTRDALTADITNTSFGTNVYIESGGSHMYVHWFAIGIGNADGMIHDVYVYSGERYSDQTTWVDPKPTYTLYVDDVVQDATVIENEQTEAGINIVRRYDKYSVPYGATVKYIPTTIYTPCSISTRNATANHYTTDDSVAVTEYTSQPVSFTMGVKDITLNDQSGQRRITIETKKGSQNPKVKLTYTLLNDSTFTTKRLGDGNTTSLDMKNNTTITFQADNDSNYIWIYQGNSFKAEITGTETWTSSVLTSDVTFTCRGYNTSYYYDDDCSSDCCCVAEGTLVTCYKDDKYILTPIEQVQTGDIVVGANGQLNEVYARTDTTLGKTRTMFTFEDNSLYFTGEHSIWTRYKNEEYFGIHDISGYYREKTATVNGQPLLEWEQEKVYRENGITDKPISKGLSREPIFILFDAEYGTDKGWKHNRAIIAKDKVYPNDTPVHTLILGGNHTFFGNGYLLSGFATDTDYDYSQVEIKDLRLA